MKYIFNVRLNGLSPDSLIILKIGLVMCWLVLTPVFQCSSHPPLAAFSRFLCIREAKLFSFRNSCPHASRGLPVLFISVVDDT